MPSKSDISRARAKTIEVAQQKKYVSEARGTADCEVWLDHPIQAVLGDRLRTAYDHIVLGPVPAALLKLIDELDHKQRR